LQLHGWSLGLFCSIDLNTDCHNPRPAFFHPFGAFLSRNPLIVFSCGLGDRALQECNLSTKPSVDCSIRIPSGPGKNSDRISAPKDAIASHGQSEKLNPHSRPSGRCFSCHITHELSRTAVFGESAALGDPAPSYGAGRYLQAMLSEQFPDEKFEVVNVSITAINSHAILPIARECARQQGDFWIIYMGKNEMVGPFGAASVFARPFGWCG